MSDFSLFLVWALTTCIAVVAGAYVVSAPWQRSAGGRAIMGLLGALFLLAGYVGFARFIEPREVRLIVLNVLLVILIVSVAGLGRAILKTQVQFYRMSKHKQAPRGRRNG